MARESIFHFGYFSGCFIFIVIALTIMLYCTFRRISLLSFYIFFKSRLIPTLFLILGWGYQPECVQAGIYLLFYTLLASLPLLVGILASVCLFVCMCLHIRTQALLQIFTEFFIGEFIKFINVPVFVQVEQ